LNLTPKTLRASKKRRPKELPCAIEKIRKQLEVKSGWVKSTTKWMGMLTVVFFPCKDRELEGTLQFSRFPHYALKTARVVYERS
jgi:hypothetical protein